MKTRRIPITIQIDETQRANFTLGTNTRLNPNTHAIELYPDSTGMYSLTSNLTVKTRVFNPESVKKFVGFDVDIVNVYDPDLETEVTGANYRLNDGTNDRYWDGGSWAVAGASDWNTEAEIADNIASFPVSACKIQVVINPYTVLATATPKISEIRILMESDLEELEDLVWRSLVRKIRSDVRPITDHPITLSSAGATIDLNTYSLKTPYNVIGVDSVFNYDTDPKGQADILDSYDASTKVITLNQSLASGTRVWIKILYEPEVAVTTSQEYDELAKVPAIIFTDINAVNSAGIGAKTAVRNKSQYTAVLVPAKHIDIDMAIEVVADKQKDLQRLSQELDRFFGNNPLLRSTGLDRDYRLWLIDEYDGTTVANQNELHTGRFRARIAKALFFDSPAEDVYAVKQFTLQGDMDTVIS